MTSSSLRQATLSRVSTALLDAVDNLAEEFPHLPVSLIYLRVGEARGLAAKNLPNVEKYEQAIEREARVRLLGEDS